jgi:hypothetical protein
LLRGSTNECPAVGVATLLVSEPQAQRPAEASVGAVADLHPLLRRVARKHGKVEIPALVVEGVPRVKMLGNVLDGERAAFELFGQRD